MSGRLTSTLSETIRAYALPAFGLALAIAAASYLLLGITSGLRNTKVADAQTTAVLYWLTYSSDSWWNFDFRGNDLDDEIGNPNEVDWPIRFLFYNDAEIDKVKDAIDGCGGNPSISPNVCSSGSAQYHYMYDSGGELDGDGGKKQSNSCTTGAQHMRLYADPTDDRNYSTAWGYYIFASVHKDFEGGSGGSCTTYFSADGEEGWWVNRIEGALGSWNVYEDVVYWYNEDSGHWDLVNGNWHWTQSNGYATYIWVD